jgi:hypothetical protein
MGDLSAFHGLTKEQWIEAIDAIHENLRKNEIGFEGYGPGSMIERTGWEAWEGYFSDGYSPQAAFDEDRSYWEGGFEDE